MPRPLYFLSFLLIFTFFLHACGGGSEKETAQEEDMENTESAMQKKSAEIEAIEPETQSIEDIKDLPSIYWGTWINEGELSKLELKDDGTCELQQDNPEAESLKIQGEWESNQKGIKIIWEKPYMDKTTIEYRFEQTESQKLLFWKVEGNEQMAFYQDL